MGREYTREERDGCLVITAIETDDDENLKMDSSRNPAPKGGQDDFIPSSQEALAPVCPDPDKGFEPLSEFLVQRITNEVMRRMKEICYQRDAYIDFKYWKHITQEILSAPTTEKAIIVPAPAGAGKSTWIQAFTSTFVSLLRSDPDLADALVGVAVVLQKVEDLNQLAELLNSDSLENNPNMIALQGWTASGQRRGFCQNPAVQRFDECVPSACPRAATCKLRTFREQSLTAPIVGLTQERFDMLRGSDGLNMVLYRMDENGRLRPRRFLIFDEKFPMAQVYTLDKNVIDLASLEMTKLITRQSTTDSRVKSLQQQLSILIGQPFQKLRGSLRVSVEHGEYSGEMDIQVGFCTLDELNICQDIYYDNFRSYVVDKKPQYASKPLRDAISVMDALYKGERCLFSKTNGFAISHILPPNLQFGQSQTIIFDATALVDEDYYSLARDQFLPDDPKRKSCQVEFHIFTHRDLNVSKKAMQAPWKLLAFSQFIRNLSISEDMFICTYKDQAEALAAALEEVLPPEKFRHILLMENREHPTIPYLGGTNGSNQFHTATQVFMLGYPRLNPRDYLIHTCAAYGTDQLSGELDGISPERLTSKDLSLIYSLPSVRAYVVHHLAARLEQEIYRCALRNPGFTGKIMIYLFCPPADVMEILRNRIPGKEIIHDELPPYVEVCKSAARRYEDGSTSFGRLALFLKDWDGAPIADSVLREQLNISAAVWKDLIADERVQHLFTQYNVLRTGRGRNAKLYIEKEGCA